MLSSTDGSGGFIRESFQLTHGEAIAGIRYTNVPPQGFSPADGAPTVRLIVIDDELYVMDEGSPPGLDGVAEDAGAPGSRGL